MKKLFAWVLAFALCLSLAYPIYAVDSYTADGTTATFALSPNELTQSDSAQNFDLTLTVSPECPIKVFDIELTLPTGITYVSSASDVGAITYNNETGYMTAGAATAIELSTVVTITLQLAANAAVGEYEIGALLSLGKTDDYFIDEEQLSTTLTVTEAPAEPEFSVYYVIPTTLPDADEDTWREVEPSGTFTADVYVSADTAGQTLEAFDIYPLSHANLEWTGVTGEGYTAVKGNTYFAFYNTDTGNPTNIAISTEGTKIATLTFAVSEDAVYDEHMPIWFGNETNLAIKDTAENARLTDIDTTGTHGVETLATVTVTFNANGGTGNMDTQAVPYNLATALNANAFTREDYTFLGWAESDSATAVAYADEAEVTLKENKTLYAVWQQVNAAYTVEHWQQNVDNDEYTLVSADTETKKGTIGEATAAAAKTYEGFTAQTITQETIAATGTVVRVYYDRNTYSVTYTYLTEPTIPEGAPSVPTQTDQRFGKLVQVQAKPEMEGYELDDWSSRDTEVNEGTFTMPAKNVTLEAAWRAKQFEATLDPADHGSLPDGTINPITVTYNDTWPTLPSPTPSNGYEFDGWYNGTTLVQAGETVTITGDVTLTARYNPINYTITFVYNNGNANGTQTYTIESTDTLTNPTKTNYRFTGWTITAADGTSWATKDGTLASSYTLNGDYGNVTLTANWELDAKVAVLPYAYAYGTDGLLLVGGDPGDRNTYFYNGTALYKITGDSLSAYQAKLGENYIGDVYAYIVATDGATTTAPAMVGELTVGSGTSEELSKNGLVNGDTAVNSADANAVFQMLVNHDVYTNAQLSVKGRLIADMVSNDGDANFGSIADVNAIIELIKSNHS